MPELPEVENIRAQIKPLAGAEIISIQCSNLSLRYKLSLGDHASIQGSQISAEGPQRLGRYILLPLTTHGMLMIHLGMTGALRLDENGMCRKHDHVCLRLLIGNKITNLIYNDPRRFGGIKLMPVESLAQAKKLLNLGHEPTKPIEPHCLAQLYNLNKPIKPLLMDNSIVTGIGNIYASEICHDACISPHRLGSSLGVNDFLNLSLSMYKIISAAIANGGSTLRNYVHIDGSAGAAQQEHRVYGRLGALCSRCGETINSAAQGGRTSFYCPCCQH